MTESHLARTLFSQPQGQTPVKKKVVRSTPEVPKEPPVPPQPTDWQAKAEAYAQVLAQAQALIQSLQAELAQAREAHQQLQAEYTQSQLHNHELEQRIAELEAQLALILDNESLPNSHQEMALKQQINELQEQVLHQASQLNEYQTAIQYWKDQSLKHQQHALQLSSAIERLLSAEQPLKRVKSKPAIETEPKPGSATQIELPSFLTKVR
ncbi:MAG: hypothetical protein ACK4QL_06250 [Pseudanabaenaceae cyanobacterium]